MEEFVSPARLQLEPGVTIRQPGQVFTQVEELLCHEMNDLSLPLDADVDRHHAGPQHYTPPLLEQAGPDNHVRRTGLVLDGDEHDTLRGARILPNEDQTCRHQPASVTGCHRVFARDDVPLLQVSPEERDRMLARSQARVAVVLDHVVALGHLPQFDFWLSLLGDDLSFALGGGGEQR